MWDRLAQCFVFGISKTLDFFVDFVVVFLFLDFKFLSLFSIHEPRVQDLTGTT